MKLQWIGGSLMWAAFALGGCAAQTPAKEANSPVVGLAPPSTTKESTETAFGQDTLQQAQSDQSTNEDRNPPQEAAVGTMFGSSMGEGDSFGFGGLGVGEAVSGGVPGGTVSPDPLAGGVVGGLAGSTSSSQVGNSIDKEMIRRFIRLHIAEVKKCYEDALKTNPDLEGRVILRFTIAKSGDVVAATIAHSTMKDPSIGNCIASKALTWRFPEHPGPGPILINYPFVFKSA